jgi:hypothetical protein
VVSLLLVRASISSPTGMNTVARPITAATAATTPTTLNCRRTTPRSASRSSPAPRLTNIPRLSVRNAGGSETASEAIRIGRSRPPRTDRM